MDAAETPRAHEANADSRSRRQRAADGCRADRSLDGANREIAGAELAGRRREALELGSIEADPDLTVENE
jgi:hypothetical protein